MRRLTEDFDYRGMTCVCASRDTGATIYPGETKTIVKSNDGLHASLSQNGKGPAERV